MRVDEFRRHGEVCVRLAEEVRSIEDKAALLSMAQTWILLADQGQNVHRLIREEDPQPSS